MKVVFITPVTPYKENMGGPSGHPYHLMIERPEGIDITIYSYNNNHLSGEVIRQVEKELRVEIKLLKSPRWLKWILKLHLTFIRLLLNYPINCYRRLDKNIVQEIQASKPDLVWGYGQEFNGILRQFKEFQRLHTVPDCYSLHYYRRLGKRFGLSNLKEYWLLVTNYIKHYRMERDFDSSINIVYHLVGEEDKKFLLEINPKLNAHFIRHPHYDVKSLTPTLSQKERSFHQPKIKLLIAGRYDIYSFQGADELLGELRNCKIEELKNAYTITFLGKGWEKHIEALKDAGYEVNYIKFAPDYIEEITKHDIQINPLSVGTGTKGKVLDALANGLLVIGTPYALENIAVKHGESCIEYRHPQEVIEVLKDIPNNIHKYEMVAAEGRKQVLTQHDRAFISLQLFNLVKQC